MSVEHEQLKEILAQAACHASPEARRVYLDTACQGDDGLRAQVEGLLTAHELAGDFLEHSVLSPNPEAASAGPGTIIGHYELLQEIGEGGFGQVFMAEQQAPVHREVAIKIIKAGMDTREVIGRFEAERQALAMMDHPHIARVLDAGTTESGRPYFVMELVNGIPITAYCDQSRLGTEPRLELFLKVCHAVQHAHQKGIIHRDLKPTNILVTLIDGEPVPKIIDFGVAKALGQKLAEKTLFTAFQQMIGTPAYMSPEQAGLGGVDVDTRSDIYSLGVLLYELLTGVTPLDHDTLHQTPREDLRRLLQETEPLKPSTRVRTLGSRLPEVADSRQTEALTLTRLLHGDLDCIVMKALEKDRGRRYGTVAALAEDIERHLQHQPVLARAPSLSYRVCKFIRRNRVAAGISASVALGLLGTTVALWLGLERSHYERDRATVAEAKARAEQGRAEAALARSQELLWQANFDRAQALRRSGGLGQRVKALAAIRAAAAIRVAPELRTEAIAALALPDVEDVGAWSPVPTNMVRVAIDSAGERFAVITSDGQIEVRWFTNHLLQARLTNGPQIPSEIRFNETGARLLVRGQDRSLVWDAERGEVLLEEPGTRCLGISSNGRHAARLGEARTITVWDLDQRRELARWATTQPPHWGAFSPDDQRLALFCTPFLEVWDWSAGRKVAELELPAGSLGMAWRADGTGLAVGCEDRSIYLWQPGSTNLRRLIGHTHEGIKPFYHPGGVLLASAGWDETLRLWDAGTGTQWLASTLARELGFSRDGRRLAVQRAHMVGMLRVHVPDVCRFLSSGLQANQIVYPHFSPDSRFVAGLQSGQFVVWDVESGRLLCSQPADSGPASSLVVLDSSTLLTVAPDGVQAWTNLGSSSTWRISRPTKIIDARARLGPCQLSPDRRQLVLTVGESGTVYDLAATARRGSPGTAGDLPGGEAPIEFSVLQPRIRLTGQPLFWHAAFSPDGKWIASGYWNNQGNFGSALWFWSSADGRPLHRIPMGNCVPFFSPDGRWFLAAASREYRLFAIAGPPDQWREVWRQTREDPGFSHSAAAFSPDSASLALQADQRIVRLVATETGRELALLTPPATGILDLAWSPDGRWLAAACGTGTQLWDLQLLRLRLRELGLDWE